MMMNQPKAVASWSATMTAARLHGPADLRIEHVPSPAPPGPGEALIRVKTVGICGSDLHTYQDGRLGDTLLKAPVIMGHEFAGVVEAAGPQAIDGTLAPLEVGAHVAVDPSQACGHCDLCEQGHPNLCRHLHFTGLYPDDGALCQWIKVPAATCFPVPRDMDFADAAMLEVLGVAIHAADLARIRVANSLAILGCGPIGLAILQVARLAGADPIFVSDKFPWRLELARRFGATTFCCDQLDPVQAVSKATGAQGVDIAIEAAWADHSVQQAADMVRPGGRVVLVGIPGDDRLTLKHSTARRKGLTIRLARRMKHAYPRAIHLAQRGLVDLKCLVSHRLPLEKTAEAFAMNVAYRPGVMKIVIDV